MCLSISMYEYPGDKGAAAAASVAMKEKWSSAPVKQGMGGAPPNHGGPRCEGGEERSGMKRLARGDQCL